MDRFCIVNKESITFQEKLLKVERNKRVCWCGILTFETTSLRRKLKGVGPHHSDPLEWKKVREKDHSFPPGLELRSSLIPKFSGAPLHNLL